MGSTPMTESRGHHPPIEDLAAFAEGHAPDRAAIETHIDGCESCAQEVLAAIEAVAFESLGDGRPAAPREFEARARGALAKVFRGDRPKGDGGGFGLGLDGLGMAGLFGGGGLGSVYFSPGADLVLASDEHPHDLAPESRENPGRGEIPPAAPASHAGGDEIDRMLDRIRDALGDEPGEHHGAARMPIDEGHPGHDGPSSAIHPEGEPVHDDPAGPGDDDDPGHPWDHDHDDSHG